MLSSWTFDLKVLGKKKLKLKVIRDLRFSQKSF